MLEERWRRILDETGKALARLSVDEERMRAFWSRAGTSFSPKIFFQAFREFGEKEVLLALSQHFHLPMVSSRRDLRNLGIVGDKDRIESAGFLTCWKLAFVPCVAEGGKSVVLSATPLPMVSVDPKTVVFAEREYVYRVLREFRFEQFLGEGGTKPGRFDMDDFVDYLLLKALSFKATDIHIFYDETLEVTRVFFRILGSFREIERLPVKEGPNEPPFHLQIANKLYNLIGKDTQSYRRLTDGAFVRRLQEKVVPLRLSSIPVMREATRDYVPSIVLRILKSGEEKIYSLQELGFFGRGLTLLEKFKNQPHGIFLVVGPTGSGKSTTLYSLLSEKVKEDVCVLTVEDPVELRISKSRQVEINPQVNLTFPLVMRSFLRHDPDIILVGEIRDAETAQTAVEASLTGHLVLGTVHVNDAYSVVARFTETLGINARVLLETLVFVLSQRLVKTLCPHCRKPVTLENLKEGLLLPDLSGYQRILGDMQIYVPKGCPFCEGRGYLGRTVVFEMIPFRRALREEWLAAISAGRPMPVRRVFELSGGVSFGECALDLLKEGRVSLVDLERAIGPLPEFFPNGGKTHVGIGDTETSN